ncbi:MAG: PEP-CTERM sorting domain-containing protein [Planctomycetes bacterium]|nr:PEP-CTERM sorting domain-containing protein [Planctomycetota bacterium]
MIRVKNMARAAAVAAALLLGAAAAAQAETKTIVLTGQSAPGTGGGTFGYVSDPALNASGQAAFQAYLTGTSDGSTYGIFSADGSTTTAIARQLGSAPGTGGGTFTQIGNYPALNASGQAAFCTGLTGTSDGSTQGIFRGDGSALTAIARQKWAAPGTGGGTFSYFSASPALNASGQAAFWAALTGTTDGSNYGIFRGSSGTPTAIARDKWAAPGTGGGTFSSTFSDPALNASGQAAFQAGLTGTSDGSTGGIFRGDGSTTTAIAREKWAAPGTGGGTFAYLSYPALNASGQAAFYAELTGTSDGSSVGLFRGDGSTTVAIAREKWAAPGTGGGTFWYFSSAALNASGQAAFYASLTGTSDGSTQGIFRGDGSTLTAIARQKWAAPGTGGGTFSSFGSPALNASGQAAFYADLTGTAGGTADNVGIFLADEQERIVAVRKGDALEGSTVTAVGILGGLDAGGRSGLNDYGQVAYYAHLADGHYGVFLFTPELHWRAAGSGTWDAAANWTVGLDPAAVHPVIIDPSSSLTVTGPAGLTTVKTLTVGAQTAGQTATLTLSSATGALTVTGAAAIQATGRISVNDGTLTVGSLANAGALTVAGGTLGVSGAFTNNAGGLLAVAENQACSIGGAITNAGEILLGGGAAAVANGATLTNSGLLRGDGRITGALANDSGGEIRAEAGKRLKFDGDGGTNLGLISLLGGTAEFAQPLTNGATGAIMGRGTLITGGTGLTNNGNLGFSGGFTDVFGDLANNAGAKAVISGGGTATFYDDVVIDAASQFKVSEGCAAVFFGSLSGEFNIGGTGTVYNEGDLRPGHSPAEVSFEGDLVLGGAARLVAELGGAAPGTGYDVVNVGGNLTLGGTLDVELLYGYSPSYGTTFDLLDWGALAGQFDAVDLPALGGGLGWDTSGLYSSGTIGVVPEPATLALLMAGGAVAAGFRFRRRP